MPINRPDKVLEVKPGDLDVTSMRYHELWLQRWLYSRFVVREGYPVPVVFATPMDAFSLFSKLWADENNPFAYLFALKDAHGTPLYEPHPSPVRYPLISASRQGIKLRPGQNFSTHRWRHLNWPTVSDTMVIPGKEQQGTDLTKCDLGEVTTSRMPMALDYRFQIDHFCLRPDTQAFFIEKLLNQFWRSGGGVLQTWMDIEYPGWGQQYIRVYLDGDVDNRAPEEAELQDKNVEFRTSFTLVVEGFSIDVAYETVPALWKLVATSARIEDLDRLLVPAFTTDLRTKGYNYVLESRSDIPAAGTCQSEGLVRQYLEHGTLHVYFGDPAVPDNPAQNVAVPGPATGGNQPPGYTVIEPQYAYGIESTLVFGYPWIDYGTLSTVLISGTVTPPAAGIGIELPTVGTVAASATTGYYVGTVPQGYSGTAVPHYAGATSFTPPVRVYTNQTVDATGQDYAWTADVEVHFRGSDALSFDASMGNISEYLLYNFVNDGTLGVEVYGTHFEAAYPVSVGTEYGTFVTTAFGTHLDVTVLVNPGTEYGTYAVDLFGTHVEVIAAAPPGTAYGTVAVEVYGTTVQTVYAAGGGTNYGTMSVSIFGDYLAV